MPDLQNLPVSGLLSLPYDCPIARPELFSESRTCSGMRSHLGYMPLG